MLIYKVGFDLKKVFPLRSVFLYKNLIERYLFVILKILSSSDKHKVKILLKLLNNWKKKISLSPMKHLSALRFNSRRLFVRAVAEAAIVYRAPSFIIYQRQTKKGRRRQINVRKLSTWLNARFDNITNSPSGALLHCCVSLSRVGRRGRHIPGAEAGRRDPWKLDKLTTYASHSRTSPFRCSTFVSEGLLPSLFLVHLW